MHYFGPKWVGQHLCFQQTLSHLDNNSFSMFDKFLLLWGVDGNELVLNAMFIYSQHSNTKNSPSQSIVGTRWYITSSIGATRRHFKQKHHKEGYSSKKPSILHLKTGGCICYTRVLDINKKKLDAKSRNYISLVYSEESKAYWLYDWEARKILTSHNVVFDEEQPYLDNEHGLSSYLINGRSIPPSFDTSLRKGRKLNI